MTRSDTLKTKIAATFAKVAIWTNSNEDRAALIALGFPRVASVEALSPVFEGGKLSLTKKFRADDPKIDLHLIVAPATAYGIAIENEIVRVVGVEKAALSRLPSSIESLSGLVGLLGPDAIFDRLAAYSLVPCAGLLSFSDYEAKSDALYTNGPDLGVSTGFPKLDELFRLVLGRLYVWTGVPSHGKSTVVDSIVHNAIALHGWKAAIFSPETGDAEDVSAAIIRRHAGKKFFGPDKLSPEEYTAGKAFVNQNYYIISPTGTPTLAEVLRLATIAVRRSGVRILVIDAWNCIDHTERAALKMPETEYIGHALEKIRAWQKMTGCIVMLVAHPTKIEKGDDGEYKVPGPYSISGSANWFNKADFNITVWRKSKIEDFTTEIYVDKIKKDYFGRKGDTAIGYNKESSRFSNDSPEDGYKPWIVPALPSAATCRRDFSYSIGELQDRPESDRDKAMADCIEADREQPEFEFALPPCGDDEIPF